MRKIELTDYGTLLLKNYYDTNIEVQLDDFLKEVEDLHYYKGSFEGKLNGEEVILYLTSEEQENYENDNYSFFNIEYQKIIKVLKKSEIIINAKNGKIPNQKSQQIYLGYLSEKVKKLDLDIWKNFGKNIKDSFKKMIYDLDFENHFVFNFLCIGFGGLFSTVLLIGFLAGKVPFYLVMTALSIFCLPVIPNFIYPFFKELIISQIKDVIKLKKDKKNCQNIIKNVKNMKFSKVNNLVTDNFDEKYQERLTVDYKTTVDILSHISKLTMSLEKITDLNLRKQLAIELQQLITLFNESKKKLESLNPNEQHMILNDKIKIEQTINFKINELEQQINYLISKQERQATEEEMINEVQKKLQLYTRGSN